MIIPPENEEVHAPLVNETAVEDETDTKDEDIPQDESTKSATGSLESIHTFVCVSFIIAFLV